MGMGKMKQMRTDEEIESVVVWGVVVKESYLRKRIIVEVVIAVAAVIEGVVVMEVEMGVVVVKVAVVVVRREEVEVLVAEDVL